MGCPRCHSEVPEVAHFCHVCGLDQRSDDQDRRRSFAAKPDEPVASFALISTIMPQGVGQRPQTYRIGLVIALVIALAAAIFGALPIAVLVAAFAIPVIYIVYLYDVNLWDDAPIPVTGIAFGLTGLLAIGFTVTWRALSAPEFNAGTAIGDPIPPSLGGLLFAGLLIPLVGEAIRQVGPLLLASRPKFDDLMDGLTFGVISGVSYATFDTLVRHWSLLTGGLQSVDPGVWVPLIFLEGFVKPLVMGTATGIACAEFSGLGRGYDGFTKRYARGLVEAVGANVAFAVGLYLFGFVGDLALQISLSSIWGLMILAVLILRVRTVLHVGLMEAALERTARVGHDAELSFCARCEMPLFHHAAFCTACGTAVRIQSKEHHPSERVSAGVGAASPDQLSAGSVEPAGPEQTMPIETPQEAPPGATEPRSGAGDDARGDRR